MARFDIVFSTTGYSRQQIELVAIFKVYSIQQLYVRAVEQDITVIPNGLSSSSSNGLNPFLEYGAKICLHISSDIINTIYIDGYGSCS